jgi:hypothetical protein
VFVGQPPASSTARMILSKHGSGVQYRNYEARSPRRFPFWRSVDVVIHSLLGPDVGGGQAHPSQKLSCVRHSCSFEPNRYYRSSARCYKGSSLEGSHVCLGDHGCLECRVPCGAATITRHHTLGMRIPDVLNEPSCRNLPLMLSEYR